MELLVVSHTAPYETAGMAGEKIHNYYVKAFASQEDISVRLITICRSTDVRKLDLDDHGIKNKILVEGQGKIISLKRKIIRAIHLIFNPNDKYANFVSRERYIFFMNALKEWKMDGYRPDRIILEFTHSILLIEKIQEIFPGVPVIGASHDVNYKGSYRLWHLEKNRIVKYFRKRQYYNLKNREIMALSHCDLIVTYNENDIAILKKESVLSDKEFLKAVPYFDSYEDIKRHPDGKTIIFFGSMKRQENYRSIQWFIEEVFNKLENDMRFVIIGGDPPDMLKRYGSERIHLTGFLPIEKVKEYFSICECMVVPLLLGSGIKVKILEAFSGGVPVLTNEIGNEGIYAKKGEQFLYCETAKDFIDTLKKIGDGSIDLGPIGRAGKDYVKQKFDLKASKDKYIARVKAGGSYL